MQELKTIPSAVYLDLEWNCADFSRQGDPEPEIIEIGLAELDPISLRLVREANYLVRPRHLDICLRCTSITGLTRDDLRKAKPLRDVVSQIAQDWPSKTTCFAWGDDGDILTRACKANHLPIPFRHFVDLNQTVRLILLLSEQLSVRNATTALGLPIDECRHVAVADARQAALIHGALLRRLRSFEANAAASPKTNPTTEPTWFAQMMQKSIKTIAPLCESQPEHPNDTLATEVKSRNDANT
jgi:inhibitor of KinA sporulation pathway (predicted exonuclease)